MANLSFMSLNNFFFTPHTSLCFLFLLLSLNFFSSSSSAMEQNLHDSESSFDGYFIHNGASALHASSYTQEEIEIIETCKLQLLKPQSSLKDHLIEINLIGKFNDKHKELLMRDFEKSCGLFLSTSIAEKKTLEEIAAHALNDRVFLCFGRNRTFLALRQLGWIHSDDSVTQRCPSVFKKIWQDVLDDR